MLKLKILILFVIFSIGSCGTIDLQESLKQATDYENVIFDNDNSKNDFYAFDKVNDEASVVRTENFSPIPVFRTFSKLKNQNKFSTANFNFCLTIKNCCLKRCFLLSNKFLNGFYLYFFCVLRN